MEREALLTALRRMAPETGSLACLGCGYEHSCSIHGCAVIRAAVEEIERLAARRSFLLDRSLWPVEECFYCRLVASHPGNLTRDPDKSCQYCADCGRPWTEKAWARLERRIGGAHEAD